MSTDELKRQITDARARVTQLRSELVEAEELYRQLRTTDALTTAGLKVGDRVAFRWGRAERFGYLAEVNVFSAGWVDWVLHPEKIDGTPAQTRVRASSAPTPAPKATP